MSEILIESNTEALNAYIFKRVFQSITSENIYANIYMKKNFSQELAIFL